MEYYYLVAFTHDDKDEAQEFYEKSRNAIRDSVDRFRQIYLSNPSLIDSLKQSLSYIEVLILTPISADVRKHCKDVGFEIEMPAECEPYSKVYFLNEAALRMYEEQGVKFEASQKLPIEKAIKIATSKLKGVYLPKSWSQPKLL